jgi:hypothetical protein
MSTTAQNLLSATTHQPPAAHLLIVAVLLVVTSAVLLVRRIRQRRRGHSPAVDQQAGSRHLHGTSTSQPGEAQDEERPPHE